MPLDKPAAKARIQKSDFTGLFTQELGWDNHKSTLNLNVAGSDFTLNAVAEKRGFVAYHCPTPSGESLPDYSTRRRIEREVARAAHEHVVIFTDSAQTTQVWQWVKREPGKPTACREHTFHRGHSGEALLQKLEVLFVSLEDEEAIALTDVTRRARAAFDVERVTKKFYEQFRKEHAAFLKFVDGIAEVADRQWYASLMLNRLMFVYFIQRKGFLDGDTDYLRNRLVRVQREHGKDKFHGFYRYFLLRLFHEGLGGKARPAELEKLIGRIPYLNGGLFERHKIEIENPGIQIPDRAFERIFDFFKDWHWHLDERPSRADDEINPDVLGFIFERYINDQAKMGAYYTKEDITGYIGKNTVIPFLFDAARAKCRIAFERTEKVSPPNPTVWDLLLRDPDRYFYADVRHGVSWDIHAGDGKGAPLEKPRALPAEIAAGLDAKKPDLISRRKAWNKEAPSTHALPTETWREVIARRQRAAEVRAKLAGGEVRDINHLITLNLDVRQFAQDVISGCDSPELLRAFWHAIERLSVLDPTCGSGAFLFAALTILEPLYEACLERMAAFITDLDAAKARGEKHDPKKFADFREVLARVATHPSARYFVFKSIILQNLFGVDLMEEAVEICKLRLFLKLAAQVEPDTDKPNLGIEPLPDIDFNIRAGNSLVGYATADEVRRCMTQFGDGQMRLGVEDELNSYTRFAEKAELADQAFRRFREMQNEHGMEATQFVAAKATLRERLKTLETELNRYLASDYGVKAGNKAAFAAWVKTHAPFHWFVEFFGIINDGGFDVIIGNPPYVVNTPEKVGYRIREDLFSSYSSKNLYSFVVERSLQLGRRNAAVGMIVQLTALSAEKMSSLQDLLLPRGLFMTPAFPRRPESIFDGVEMPVTILLSRAGTPALHTTRVSRFYTEERPTALNTMVFTPHAIRLHSHRIAKFGSPLEVEIYRKLQTQKTVLGSLVVPVSKHLLYYQEACRYWVKACVGLPFFRRNGDRMAPPHGRTLNLRDAAACALAGCLVNSSLFYWFYSGFSDCEHINDALLRDFKIPTLSAGDWLALQTELSESQKVHARRKTIMTKQGHKIEYDEMDAPKSKPILDKIDTALAKCYGFTDEELDFIVNYDIKYRLGRGAETEDE